jgi:hypothetical protein
MLAIRAFLRPAGRLAGRVDPPKGIFVARLDMQRMNPLRRSTNSGRNSLTNAYVASPLSLFRV